MGAVIEKLKEKAGCDNLSWVVTSDTDTFPIHYTLLLENDQGLDLSVYSEFANEELMKINPRYADMLFFMVMGNMKIKNLKKGTFEEWKQYLVTEKGVSPTQVKPVTVLDNEEKTKFFLNRVMEN